MNDDQTVWTPKNWYATFLDGLSTYPNVSKAARRAKVARGTVYEARENDPVFRGLWDKALEFGVGALEDMAVERARISDTLLIFLLKAHKPKLYRDVVDHRHGGNPDAPPISHIVAVKPEGA